jgi:hypothetical protein
MPDLIRSRFVELMLEELASREMESVVAMSPVVSALVL